VKVGEWHSYNRELPLTLDCVGLLNALDVMYLGGDVVARIDCLGNRNMNRHSSSGCDQVPNVTADRDAKRARLETRERNTMDALYHII
jgi:hypothetical protein